MLVPQTVFFFCLFFFPQMLVTIIVVLICWETKERFSVDDLMLGVFIQLANVGTRCWPYVVLIALVLSPLQQSTWECKCRNQAYFKQPSFLHVALPGSIIIIVGQTSILYFFGTRYLSIYIICTATYSEMVYMYTRGVWWCVLQGASLLKNTLEILILCAARVFLYVASDHEKQ